MHKKWKHKVHTHQFIFGSIFANIARYFTKIELDLLYAILHNQFLICIEIDKFVSSYLMHKAQRHKVHTHQLIFGSIFTNIARYFTKIELDLLYTILHNWFLICIVIDIFILSYLMHKTWKHGKVKMHQYIFGSIFTNIGRNFTKIEHDLPYSILHNWSPRYFDINWLVFKLFRSEDIKTMKRGWIWPRIP